MDTFEIEMDNIIYKVTSRVDNTYSIQNGSEKFIIRPKLDETGVSWSLVIGEASQDLVNAIAELIEEHNM